MIKMIIHYPDDVLTLAGVQINEAFAKAQMGDTLPHMITGKSTVTAVSTTVNLRTCTFIDWEVTEQ